MVAPIPLKKGLSWRGIDASMVFLAVFSFGVGCIAIPVRLLPNIQAMTDAHHELCSGFHDFAFSVATPGLFHWASEPTKFEEKIQRFYRLDRYEIIRAIIAKGSDVEVSWKNDPKVSPFMRSHLYGPGWTIDNLRKLPMEFFGAAYNAQCRDILVVKKYHPFHDLVLIAVHDELRRVSDANHSIAVCPHLLGYCNSFEPPGALVRSVCPNTCHCDQPGGRQAVPKDTFGCPTPCPLGPVYKKQQAMRQCTQTSNAILTADPVFKQHAAGIVQAVSEFGDSGNMYRFMAQSMLKNGCGSILETGGRSSFLCASSFLGGIAFWCPLYCGCNASLLPGCPQSCKLDEPIEFGTQAPRDLLRIAG